MFSLFVMFVQLVVRLSEIKNLEESLTPQIGFLLFTLSPKEDKITTMNTQKLVCNAKSTNESFVQKYLKLNKGRYVIIPFASLKEGDVFMNLEIYFNCLFHQIKWVNKTEKIIEKTEEMNETNPVN